MSARLWGRGAFETWTDYFWYASSHAMNSVLKTGCRLVDKSRLVEDVDFHGELEPFGALGHTRVRHRVPVSKLEVTTWTSQA